MDRTTVNRVITFFDVIIKRSILMDWLKPLATKGICLKSAVEQNAIREWKFAGLLIILFDPDIYIKTV